MKTTPIFSRQQLGKELASVLPEEGSEYFAQLQQLRFNRHPFARYTFLSPDSLTELVQRALDERGSLGGDDRRLMQMGGLPASAFSLDESHRYLTVPAEGRVASMDINELPEWVPVTVQAASILLVALMGQHPVQLLLELVIGLLSVQVLTDVFLDELLSSLGVILLNTV